jgi:tripartite-type tricarboxylate transporter receptor subunit TctC
LVAVASVAYTPVIIATGANSRFKTLADVVSAARAAPNGVTYGSPGNGTTIHLAGDLFGKAAKVELRTCLTRVRGRVDGRLGRQRRSPDVVRAFSYESDQGGQTAAVAVTSAVRSSSLPDVPTVAELATRAST